MKSQLLTFFVCVFIPCIVFTQDKVQIIDSLLTELQSEPGDTSQAIIYNQLASYYRNIDLDKAGFYAEKSLSLAEKTNLTPYQIKSLYLLGVIRRRQGQKNKALIFNKQSLSLAERVEDWRWYGSNCSALGNTYSSLGIYDTAMVYYIKGVEAYERTEFKSKAANIYNNIGNMLYKQNKDDLAIEYLQKALKIYEENDQMSFAGMTLMNLGRREPNDSLAMDYFQRALNIHSENNNLQGVASVNMNIGSHYMANQQYEAAIPYYQEGLRLTTLVGFQSKMATANSSLGKIYYMLEQPKLAIKHYEAAIELSERSSFREEEKETYNNLSLLYAWQEDYDQAYTYLKLSRDIGDSLLNKQNLIITSELEAKFDAKQKEAKLAQQQLTIEREKYNRNILLTGGVLVILVLTAVFQYYHFNQKRKKQEALLALEKQQTEAKQLRQLDELKSQFFTNISHELKTPLSMIITPLEEALEKSSDDNLVLAHHSSKKLFGLVNEILDLSKLEAGQLELQSSPVNIHDLLNRIFHAFTSLADRRKVSLNLSNKIDKTLWLNLDIEKFEKIINNLISNAIKFTPTDGSIHLLADISSGESNTTSLIISVNDTGAGIPPEDLDKIFDRYYQNNLGKKMGGSGIGLALSKELTHLFGGTLVAENGKDRGSIFTLNIPAEVLKYSSQPEATANDLTDISERQGSFSFLPTHTPLLMEGRRPRVLIVEDNPEMSDFLKRILSPYYDCQNAYSGSDALEKLKNHSYDLITSDLMMPEMDGLEFRKQVNKNKDFNALPFIMLTASTLETDRLTGFTLGIDDYITKPFSARELLVRIDNLLRNKLEREKVKTEEVNGTIENIDHQLIKQAEQIILNHIHLPSFKVTDLATRMNYSPRQLGRLLKKLTGLSPVNFILEIRLQKAYQYFQKRQFATVSEVRYEVGIESAAYFTTKFKQRFGKSPKEFLQK